MLDMGAGDRGRQVGGLDMVVGGRWDGGGWLKGWVEVGEGLGVGATE